MKQEQQAIRVLISRKLRAFKDLLLDSWYALGNVLLLVGGDDTVEIGLRHHAIQLVNTPVLPITTNDNKG